MNEELKAVFDSIVVPQGWSEQQKASELAHQALESIDADIPNLEEVGQEVYDKAVEGCFTFLQGEALAYLRGER